MVPLRYKLKNGDAVEIITSAKHHPSKDWLDFVVTPRARTKIKQWIMRQEREQSINLGKELLEKGLDKSGTSLGALMKETISSRLQRSFPSTRLRIFWRTLASAGFQRNR